MAQDLLDLPLFEDLDYPMADDSLFADLISPNFLAVLEQAELTGRPAGNGSPTSSVSENDAVLRCPSAEVSSQTGIFAQQCQQLHQQLQHGHTITTAAPFKAEACPIGNGSSGAVTPSNNFNFQWISSVPSTLPPTAHRSSPEPKCGHTSDSSNDIQERPNKRKAPEIDWRSIEDPEERRRQRRLAKNRITAARSRERKKVQLAGMEGRMQQLEAENAQLKSLLEHCMQENSSLREQLASLSRGASPASIVGGATEPAALLYIAIMLVLLHFLDARGLSQALGLLMFTYVFFTATATGKLSLKQLSSPFKKKPDSVLIKEEPDDVVDEQREYQQQQKRQKGSGSGVSLTGWQALLQQGRMYATGLADTPPVQLLCGNMKQELSPWCGKVLFT